MIIAKRYHVVSIIGEGGTAIVYKARCAILGRDVAVKMLKPEYCKDESFIQRFNHEARAAAALSHSNIVGIFDIGESDGVPFIVMEYVDGKDLKTLVKEEGRISPELVEQISLQLLSALEYAHTRGLVHRDIKPHNILLDKDGNVKVADFGIAKAVTESTLVHTGLVIGSVHYLSPEQARGGLVDARADLYSTGIMLYELLSGKLPFDGDNPISVALMHIRENPTPLRELESCVPKKWETIVMKAIEKSPESRYQSAKEMRLAIINGAELPSQFARGELHDGLEKTVEIEKSRIVSELKIKKSPKNKFKLTPRFFIFLGLILIAIFGYLLFEAYLNVPEVKVPLVEGLAVSAAEETLLEQGLKMNVEREINDEKALPGTIVYQEIPAGANVKKGTTVNVVISTRDGKMTMPDLVGMTQEQALKSISDAGLRQGQVSEDFSDTVEKGKVLEQSPLAGTIVYAGDKINLVISKGVVPVEIPMPNLIGLSLADAKSMLEQYNLTISQVIDDYDPAFQKGQITRQSPVTGNLLSEGSGIKVWVHNELAGGSKNVRIIVPNGFSGVQLVKVTLNDQNGNKEIYKMEHLAGDSVSVPVNWVGDKATLSVHVGGNLLETITLGE